MRVIRFIFFSLFVINCSSIQTYLKDRGNDLSDIVNVGVEKDVYGVSVQWIGWQNASTGVGYGLRHGHFGKYSTGDKQNKIILFEEEKEDGSFKNESQVSPGESSFSITTTYYKSIHSNDKRTKKKHFLQIYPWRCYPPKSGAIFIKKKDVVGNQRYCGYRFSNSNMDPIPIELSLGFYLGLRIGLNVFEIFDLFAGFFGFDPMRDDTVNIEPRQQTVKPTIDGKSFEIPPPSTDRNDLDPLEEKE